MPSALAMIDALPYALVALDAQGVITAVNPAAEAFLASSQSVLRGTRLASLIPHDSPLFSLIGQCQSSNGHVAGYGLALSSPKIGDHQVDVQVSPLGEDAGAVLLTLHERSITAKIARQMNLRGAARSVSALAAMLAHEVKNPLSGIRGAAQLLEQQASDEDRALTHLICDETDRICQLVERMDVFAGAIPMDRKPVNIHRVLERVCALAENGFATNIKFVENYDPSLPLVDGHRDSLIQVFLNLVKNAAEAVPHEGGEIVLSTAYQQGVRLAVPGAEAQVHLPLVVSVQDNGPGISEDIRPFLFDPFATTKDKGSGLGLALVAKIVDDHGGVIEYESRPRHTVFRVFLPISKTDTAIEEGGA